MKLLQLCLDPGIAPDGTKGASIHLRSLAKGFVAEGHEVLLATAREAVDPPLVGCSWQQVRTEDELLAVIHAWQPDVLYERYSLGRKIGLDVAARLGLPFALEVNSPLVDEARTHRPRTVHGGEEEVERLLCQRADVVFAVSEPLRRHVARVRGTDAGTVVVPNGHDPELFIAPRPREGTPTIAFLGHPKPWHGSERLLELLRELRVHGVAARLLLIGGGAGAEALRDGAREAGLADAVEITGALPHDEAVRRLAAATLLVAPYPPTPFFYFCPLKVIEGMAAGLPVVSTDQGDVRAILGDTGVVVPPGRADLLRDAVAELIASPERCAELGQRARDRARQHYTWRRAAERVVSRVASLSPASGGGA